MSRKPRRSGACSAPTCRRSPRSSGRSAISIAAAGILETTVALAALEAQRRARHRDAARRSIRRARASPVSRAAQVPRSDIALVLCRGFAGTNAACSCARREPLMSDGAATQASAAVDAGDAPVLAPLRHRHRRDRAHRAAAARERPRDAARSFFTRAGARGQRRRPRTRREPRRALRRQGSVRQAVSARSGAGADRAARFLGRARQLRRAAGRCPARAPQPLAGRHRLGPIALSLTHDRDERARRWRVAQPAPRQACRSPDACCTASSRSAAA